MKLRAEIRHAIKSGPIPKLRNWRKLSAERWTRAERAMAFVETYCLIPEGAAVAQPVKLLDFQESYFYSIYDAPTPIRMGLLSMARKNGKTALIAMQLLVHLIGPEAQRNSQLVSGARSREQAAQVFNYASKMVQLSPILSSLVRIVPSGKKLIGLPLNIEYRALSAEGQTAHGLSPALAILDEVGQVRGPRDDFVEAITTSQGAHKQPLLIAISTQAASDADLLSVWLEDATLHQPANTVCHCYAADAECVLTDKAAWKQANPALGVFRSTEDLAEQIEKAMRMPSAENSIRNLCLNQRVSLHAPFISKGVWLANGGMIEPFGSTPVYAGLDLSARTDLTALVLIGQCRGIWQVVPHFWTPESGLAERAKRDRAPYDLWVQQGYLHTTPGASVDYEYVAQDIAAMVSLLDIRGIAYDRWRMDVLKREFERIGIDLPLVEWGQGFKDSAPALDALEAELLNHRVAHQQHPVLTMCASNAIVIKDPAGSRKLDKAKSTGRIDGLQAMAMAFGLMARGQSDDSSQFSAFIAAPLKA